MLCSGGNDYTFITETLTFEVGGPLQMIIPVPTIGDNINEGTETFLGVLSAPSRGARIEDGTATVTILGECVYNEVLGAIHCGRAGNSH